MELSIKEIKINNIARAKKYKEEKIARAMRNSPQYRREVLKRKLNQYGLNYMQIKKIVAITEKF